MFVRSNIAKLVLSLAVILLSFCHLEFFVCLLLVDFSVGKGITGKATVQK